MGATLAAEPRRRRRLRRRRHGRHQLRHLPRARRPARDQDRLELALPLLHRAPDGRRAERRRGRRLDRAGAPGRAARRPGVGGLGARPGLLRPRRRRGRRSPTPTRCSATSPPTGSPAGACTSTSTPPRAAIRTRRRRAARHRRRRRGVGHRAHRQRQHGERDPQGARRPRRRPPRPLADRVRRQRRGARVGDRARARHRPHPRARRPRPRSRALGVLVADYVVDLVRSYVTPLSQVDLGARARR